MEQMELDLGGTYPTKTLLEVSTPEQVLRLDMKQSYALYETLKCVKHMWGDYDGL